MNHSDKCPCGQPALYLDCCGLYVENNHPAPTPETLMRSRYSAYTRANIDYIVKTMQGKASLDYNSQTAAEWAKSIYWLKLQVIKSSWINGADSATVEFIATYLANNIVHTIHEISQFEQVGNHWFYTEGTLIPEPKTRRLSRNETCPCGSLRKFKNCHGHS